MSFEHSLRFNARALRSPSKIMESLLSSLISPILAMLVLSCLSARAQEPIVDNRLIDDSEIWVGQKTTMIVELKVPGYFSGVPAFDFPEVAGMILIPPTDRPVLTSETISDVSYTVQRHEIGVWVRKSGAQAIPAFPIRFGYRTSPIDKEVVSARVDTAPLELTAQTPPGAEGLGAIVSARKLTASETWDPEPGQAKEGDAFTRTIRFSAPELPAMAFPPFIQKPVDGLRIYPKEPDLIDRNERGDATGERVDRLSYVCEREGKFTIPAVRFTWFDLDAEKLRVVDFPAQVLRVESNPRLLKTSKLESPAPDQKDRGNWFWLVGIAAVMLTVFWKLGLNQVVPRLVSFLRPVHLKPLKPSLPHED